MRRRIIARTPSSPQRGMDTYYRSVMDRARVANRRDRFINNNYDDYNEEEGWAEDYARNRYWPGRDMEEYNSYEDEIRADSSTPYGKRREEDELQESGRRNYSRNREEYGESTRENYGRRNRRGLIAHLDERERDEREYEREERERAEENYQRNLFEWERRRDVPRGRRIRYT